VVMAGETAFGSLVVFLTRSLVTIAYLRAAKTFLKLSTTTWNLRNAWMPVQAVQNVVPLNTMLRDGKDRDASILILDGEMTELSNLHQTEDGEMLNAMPELVSTESEVIWNK